MFLFVEHLDKNRAPAKKNNHRAMDDIRESIKELKYYKETIFKANKGRMWGEVGVKGDIEIVV